MTQGLDLTDYFGSMAEETVESVEELRRQLREYISAKGLKDDNDARMSEAKKRIEELFKELPEEYKTTQTLTPKDVAGHTFNRVKKTIRIDEWVIVVNEKVNTKSPRDKYLKELRAKSAAAETPAERAAYEDAISTFESHMDPQKGTEMKIEPVKAGD